MSDCVLVRAIGSVRLIILNRPERRNGLDYEMGLRLLSEVVEASRDDEVRAIVLSGEGTAFCAGDDIATLQRYMEGDPSTAPAWRETSDAFYVRICEELLLTRKPVIAAVKGAAVGAGTELVCAADLRIGGPGTRLGSALITIGHVGATAMLQRVVGPARATEIYLSGRLVQAEEAMRLGLLDRLADDDEKVLDLAVETATSLAEGPTRAIGLFKELRERTEGLPALHALRLQDQFHHRSRTEVADSTEGPLAYLERRNPRFTGG
ncbi:enoyl-CoA hydratase/isomerase family protein [Allosalinactinospora lopnorensis]|uniref:enoyl-CoA hydratase/isomerase family protein n=1 Tax=Allosalinactinospora lopnorensis TaxID=1352348 RepID=UPI00069747B5|nr:enoyl-CoA hydratase/isomerase family protein [Allosalinactinospora lopnorensis]